ncbi:MAG: DNA polymerase IV [Eggerthellaceae bacterium]|nr:DNA polymerase IV [Eggerthellaceae bacterium]
MRFARSDRHILHVDLNCCYAQVECQAHPELRDKPVVVAGKEELRHGIVMAKNLLAKSFGIKTADTLADARRKCPHLVVLPPHYDLYKRASRETRRIYYDYTSQVEPFGIDEAWLDVTGSLRCLSMSAEDIAYEISERTKAELGLMTSVGLSWNKVFAKFGSDHKKPDAVTIIDRDNFKQIVWEAPVRKLLYVGAATERKLRSSGILTIGQLACAGDYYLKHRFGKIGFMLRDFARGDDMTEVKELDLCKADVDRVVKSYGNGTTFPRDITDDQTAHAVVCMLAESVSQRMREDGMRAKTIVVGIRSGIDLGMVVRQATLPVPTDITCEIADAAWQLMCAHHRFCWETPARGLHVCVTNLVPVSEDIQLVLFDPLPKRSALAKLDRAVDELRRRFGNKCVVWGRQMTDADAFALDAKAENTVHPIGLLHR